MIAIDANVVIALQDEGHRIHRQARELFRKAIDEREDLAISVLSLAETLVHHARAGGGIDVAQRLTELGAREYELPIGQAHELARLRAATSLRMPDVVVLHLAGMVGALATGDRRLADAARAQGVTRVIGLGL